MADPATARNRHRPARTKRVVVRLTPAELAALDTLAQREQRTRSDMARILINNGTGQQ